MAQATKKVASSSRRWINRVLVFRRNGRPSSELVPKSVDEDAVEDGMSMNTQSEDSLPSARINAAFPKGEWDSIPPTQRQLRYIKVLGGEPSSVHSKREASDLIDRLRGRRHWPLDRDRLAMRGVRAGAGQTEKGEWRSTHHSLLASVQLDLQEYVNLSLGNLKTKLSDPLGPNGSVWSQGPSEIVRRAEEELNRLALCRKHGQPPGSIQFMNDGKATSDHNLKPEHEPTPTQSTLVDKDSRVHWTDWLWLIAVFAFCVVIESMANIGLLMDALPGGALAAFLLAVLISAINVGGFGIGAGLVVSLLRRRLGGTRHWLYPITWGCWIVVAFLFNLVAGRHREAYARVVEQIREAPTAAVPSVRDILADVSFNPLTWEFQALLFALLGMFLCAVGFAKGFYFIRDERTTQRLRDNGLQEEESPDQIVYVENGDGVEAASPYRRQRFDAFVRLPQLCQDRLAELRGDVANWYRTLDQERRNVMTLLEDLKEEQNNKAYIDIIEHAFIVAHNNNNPDKIDLQRVETNRREKYAGSLAVTISASQVLDEAAALVSEWKRSGQTELDKRIADAQQEISAICKKYEPIILGTPGHLESNGKAIPPGIMRS